jgi:hypothetical protein
MYLNTATTPIGSLRADDAGYLSGWIRVPSGTPLGTNSFQIAGLLDGNQTVSMITGFNVHAPKPLTLTAATPLAARSTKLSSISLRPLRTLLTRVPATVPNACSATSSYVPSSRATVLAQSRQASTFLSANGLSCKVTVKLGSANLMKLTVRSTH